ncbi:DUF3164 family protein [Rheinheimera faecalis]|uniref:DUF3164 family protein n=1 Tax=Rheinheimera faecalis TaxID=2901141 RepID=UPI001E570AD9|nr:DUF3164 family protein [Rheinheimera faecalis]
MNAQPKLKVVPAGWRKNAVGHLVHESEIKEQDLFRDSVVTDLVTEGIALHKALKAYKEKALNDVADLIGISAQKWQMTLGGKKGNVSITSFDGELMIQRVYAERITYTEEMEVAKAKVDECVQKWSNESNPHIVTLATRAFQRNKSGELSMSRIIEMLSYKIDDPEWIAAMQVVSDSLRVCGTAVYIRIYQRDDNGKYINMTLNISGV